MGVIEKIALSNIGTKFYKYCASEKGQHFLNNRLPNIETVVSTLAYMWATSQRKEIPDRQRNMLQVQNVLSGAAGFLIGSYLNNKVSQYANKVIPHIDKQLIPEVHKVIGGLKIGLPLITTALLMRCIVPSVVAWISGLNAERKAKSTLDIKA